MKARIYNKEITTKIYFLMIHVHGECQRAYQRDIKYLLEGLLTHKDLEESRERLAIAKDLLDFFREAKTTYLNELPF